MARLRSEPSLPHSHGRDPEDRENPAAALISAWPSFQRHFLTEKRFEDATDFETLGTHFVRIATNRSGRKKREGRKTQGPDLFDVASGDTPPDESVTQAEFLAYLRAVVDEEVEILRSNAVKYRIVQTWLASDLQISQEEVAVQIGVHQSTVCRHLDDFKERIRRRLEQDYSG